MPEQVDTVDCLTRLLRDWNQGREQLNHEEQARLVRWAQADLGLPRDSRAPDADTVTALAARIDVLLPRVQTDTMASLFAYVRDRAVKALGIAVDTVRWNSSWADFAQPMSGGSAWPDREDVSFFLYDLVRENRCNASDPHELVAETVRSIWKARGGAAFWEVAPYEAHWCASQPVFYDLRRIPHFGRASLKLSDGQGRAGRVEPATRVDALLSKREQGPVIESIETRFGVWVGRRPKEGCLPLLVAGVLASPLGLFIPACVLVSVFGPGKIPGGAWTMFFLYGLAWAGAIVLYFRSQSRLSSNVRTIKDLVRLIIRKRQNTRVKARYRPIEAGYADD